MTRKRRREARAVARSPRGTPHRPVGKAPERIPAGILKLRKFLLSFSGVIKDLRRDFADNHDHYIHGTPKK